MKHTQLFAILVLPIVLTVLGACSPNASSWHNEDGLPLSKSELVEKNTVDLVGTIVVRLARNTNRPISTAVMELTEILLLTTDDGLKYVLDIHPRAKIDLSGVSSQNISRWEKGRRYQILGFETSSAYRAVDARFTVVRISSNNVMPIDSKILANKKLREISSRLRASDIDEIRKLIADGVDLDIAGQKYGFTILHLAVSRGYADIVNVIINAGGNVNVTLNKAGNGSTPLHVAVENSNSTIVKSLIAAGANVNAKKLSGSTPLSIATKYNRNDIVSILKKAGAK